jgi:hypothetical protein
MEVLNPNIPSDDFHFFALGGFQEGLLAYAS